MPSLSLASTSTEPAPVVSSRPGKIRIIAGRWRGRRLPIAAGEGLRPTGDRIRETLFSWLTPVIAGARCLDLFAGTGALGFEALSRGAAEAVMVEQNRRLVDILRVSAATMQAERAEIICADATRWLATTQASRFDIVFLDPPFERSDIGDICRRLEVYGWLSEEARIYIEQSVGGELQSLPPNWRVTRDKRAGRVRYYLALRKDVT